MDLSKLYFGALPKTDATIERTPPAPIQSDENTQTDSSVESNESNSDEILCANCGVMQRASHVDLLCKHCKEQKTLGTVQPVPREDVVTTRDLPDTQGNGENLRQLQMAPVSVRYSGKQLDEIAWSMLPALPEDIKLEIRRKAGDTARAILSNNPTVQDLDAIAEFHLFLGGLIKQISVREKDKIVLKARPELKRKNAELQAKVKAEKIQKSIPKDTTSKHAANVILDGIASIEAPLDKGLQTTMKKFLDYVALQSQVEDEINVAWVESILVKPIYAPLRQYIKLATK